jgi:Mg-chelatase subunit ChlD
LRRRPKQLDEAPLVFHATGGSAVIAGDDLEGDGRPDAPGEPPPLAGWVATTEAGARRNLEEVAEPAALAADVREIARVIERNLTARPRWRDRPAPAVTGQLTSVPYRYRSDDIDLDRTLEVLTERPVPEDTDIVVRERLRARRAVALLVDVSGSMQGEKVRIAAATVAALARHLRDDELAVIAFWKDAVVVQPLHRRRSDVQVLEDLLRLPAKGLTNVGFALEVALGELSRSRARRRSAILLSDAVHNAGPDPRLAAGRLPRLDALLEATGEHDADLAHDLARLGRGRVFSVQHHRDVAPALNEILSQ